jgi:hypothetical protein
MLDTFHGAFRGIHILVGGIGLILFWIPVFTVKGSRLHRAAGRWFVRSVYVVAGSGLISSIWAIAAPANFKGAATLPSSVADDLRFFFSILGMLSVLALQGAVLGTRVLEVEDRQEPLGNLPLRLVLAAQLLGSVALVGYAAISLWTSGIQSRYYVPLVIAIVSLIDYFEQRRFVTHLQPRRAWFYKHLECMIGCGIAFYTAASVTFFGRVLQLNLPGTLALVPWLLPTAIGLPAMSLAKRHYQRKFADQGAVPEASAEDVAVVDRALPRV